MLYLNERFLGSIFIILGLFCFIYGISFFIVPLLFIIGGLIILNNGLKMRGFPSISLLIRYWFSNYR